jgi:glutamate-ammonia-ligase adenylyltransferase
VALRPGFERIGQVAIRLKPAASAGQRGLVSIAPADLFLSPTLTADEARAYLGDLGFADPATADARLQALAEDVPVREALARLAGVLLDAVARAADPDAALAAFVRHVEVWSSKVTFLESLRADPRALGLLVDTAGRSPLVADLLHRSPELLHWLVKEVERPSPDRSELLLEIGDLAHNDWHPDAREAAMGRVQRRELLRVACRDLLGRETFDSVSEQLSVLAEVTLAEMLRLSADRVRDAAGVTRLPGRLAIVGLGRLGARDLDYGSELEMLVVYEPDEDGGLDASDRLGEVASSLDEAFARANAGGDLYAVELTERPAAVGGAPAASLRRWDAYCSGTSDARMRRALTRARLVAGDAAVGARALDVFERYVYDSGPADVSVADSRRRLEAGEPSADDDVRTASGGLGDVEETLATLRLVHGRTRTAVRTTETCRAIEALAVAGAFTEAEAEALVSGVRWLRRAEQRLALGRGGVVPTLDDPVAFDLAADALHVQDGDALRERLLSERVAVRAACRAALART